MFAGVLTDLYNEVVALEVRIRSGRPEPLPDLGGHDPMDEMELELEEQEPPRKTHKKGLTLRPQARTIKMWEWPPEAVTGVGNAERNVVVFVEGTGKLWLHKDDLEWLVRYLWIQQQLKGVAAVGSDDEGPGAHSDTEAQLTPEKLRQPATDRLYEDWAIKP